MFRSALFFLLLFSCFFAGAQSFKIVPLGVKGGADESNLSSYMIASDSSDSYVCLDAGTLHYGIEKAIDEGVLAGNAGDIMKRNIKGYLISHPHLDHLSGLIINSPDDTVKAIYGLQFCLDVLKDKYFTWKSWANFANEGDKPALNKYHYVTLTEDNEVPLEHTSMTVKPFELSHSSPFLSTAFLVKSADAYVLYLGDTGSDEVEKSDRLSRLWNQVAPLVKSKQLKAIFIEVSFPDEQPEKQLFGHLTPRLLMKEMHVLQSLAGEKSLQNFPIVITHIKPAGNNEALIRQELQQTNPLQLKLVFPEQGKMLRF
ncbi:3',5'-cyclic-nucleotide phosphodiesterase [Danxiaibacter flavus]|uniref:3',5'-cyclic-nucleotide phosphodiesterase n=2 Tax=Danxiaibacter flavus TaxID=3049108 RepID=A0ABV3ZDU9_9BACT